MTDMPTAQVPLPPSDLLLFLRRLNLETIEGYTFVHALGSGGSNITALYQDGQRKAVAKFFFVGPGQAATKKFLNEVNNHVDATKMKTALPRIYTTFVSEDGLLCGYLMEFVAGPSLGQLTPAAGFGTGPMGAAVAYRILWGYHEGVPPYVMHCDLHPENILFESSMDSWLERKPESPEIRVLDFGASFVPLKFGYEKSFDPDTWKDFNQRYQGAFYSLAPEFFTSSFYEAAVSPGVFDAWGLGLLLFKVLLGKELKIATSVGAYVELIHKGTLQSQLDRQIDEHCDNYHFSTLLGQMLRVSTADRISCDTAAHFAAQLYTQAPELLTKRGPELREYIRNGCDPEAGLPPHERSNSPY